jgi:hypothetical protein
MAERSAPHWLFGVPLHWMNDWSTPFALHVSSARGATVTDVDGNTRVDFCLGDTGAMFRDLYYPALDVVVDKVLFGPPDAVTVQSLFWDVYGAQVRDPALWVALDEEADTRRRWVAGWRANATALVQALRAYPRLGAPATLWRTSNVPRAVGQDHNWMDRALRVVPEANEAMRAVLAAGTALPGVGVYDLHAAPRCKEMADDTHPARACLLAFVNLVIEAAKGNESLAVEYLLK